MAKPAKARACGLIGHAIGDSERSREPRCEKWMAGIGPVAWRMASEWDGAPGSSGAAVPRGKRTAAWQPGRRFYAKPAVPARTPGRIVQGEGVWLVWSGCAAGWREGGGRACCATPCHSCPPAPACGRRLLLYFASGGSAAGHRWWPPLPNSGANRRAALWPHVSHRRVPVTSAPSSLPVGKRAGGTASPTFPGQRASPPVPRAKPAQGAGHAGRSVVLPPGAK